MLLKVVNLVLCKSYGNKRMNLLLLVRSPVTKLPAGMTPRAGPYKGDLARRVSRLQVGLAAVDVQRCHLHKGDDDEPLERD
ncbi:hypothetical protein BHE74_00024010 [Ensete ventricosum]|nr:hypothetical protein GW17_00023405 [Ensete ventricosum]RWW68459.1 hypothetical protein BHE74_00024010 [Ensete ventricosum]RZR90459.1 hypothetical protein BHM03_00018345 [Ensete ventricosum]